MRVYLDTSSLVKLYDPTETGGGALAAQLAATTRIVLSDLTKVEFASAFQRKARRGDVTQIQADATVSAFDALASSFDWISLSRTVLHHAAYLLRQHSALGLRSLDAIQLACALAPESRVDVFFTHDSRLQAAAQASYLATQ